MGVCCIGVATRPSTGHWVFPFLEALQLQIGIDKSREHWALIGPLISYSLPGRTQSLFHHHVLITMHLLSSDFIANATGFHQPYSRPSRLPISLLTVWNQLYLLQRDSLILIWRAMPNRDITKNQCNSTRWCVAKFVPSTKYPGWYQFGMATTYIPGTWS